MADKRDAILMIDDNEEVLSGLVGALAPLLANDDVDINTWQPSDADGEPQAAFEARLEGRTILVVTDYDLTTRGLRGLFGVSIVAWSQAAAIPVGDFSRGLKKVLPKEPNLFELRVPPTDVEGAEFIAAMYRGFRDIRTVLQANVDLLEEKRSPAAVLAALLGRPHLESQLAQYITRLGAANSTLVERLRALVDDDISDPSALEPLMSYILGHVVANAVLKFPGPILSSDALAAYCATSSAEADELAGLFENALFGGPFSGKGRYYWRDGIDAILSDLAGDMFPEAEESFGDYNRRLVEAKIGRPLAVHGCERCGGRKGGFWCPFTLRPVCERGECSVPSSSWIPAGAQLARVEREFYDELAPLLGL